MVSRFNEGKACDAVIRRIEAREGCRRGNDGRSPEREGHAAPVEFACTIGGRLFAFEHTGLEPFAGQIESEVDTERWFKPIVDRFDRRLPETECWYLHFPIDATFCIEPSDFTRARKELTRWIDERAATFSLVPYGNGYANSSLGEKIEGVPFRVSLHRWAVKVGPLGARFTLVAIAPDDLEGVRRTRLRLACERKFGKLAAWKRDHNARTVPVLEENDLLRTISSWRTRCPRQKPGYRICPTRFSS
jgi:hypothetical protein